MSTAAERATRARSPSGLMVAFVACGAVSLLSCGDTHYSKDGDLRAAQTASTPAAAPPRVPLERSDRLAPATPKEAGLPDAAVREAVALYRDEIDSGRVVGAVLLIARHGKVVVHEAFGWRDLDARAPMARTALFRMSSNTKPLTAAAVALLADRGRLRFQDQVRLHMPSWNSRRARAITIHQLLSHTSGIRIDALFAPTWIRFPWSAPRTLKTETDRIGGVGAPGPPGSSYFYTNAGYNALGGLIESVSGRLLGEFWRDEIFTPLGMSESYDFEAAQNLGSHLGRMGPTSSRSESGEWAIGWRPGDAPEVPFARGSGGLVTTAWDYAVFMQMLLNGGVYGDIRLLRPETVQTMLTEHTPAGTRGYGYGWGINDDGVFTHSGSTGTYAWGDPRRGLIVVALTQTTSASDLRPRLMEILRLAGPSSEATPPSRRRPGLRQSPPGTRRIAVFHHLH